MQYGVNGTVYKPFFAVIKATNLPALDSNGMFYVLCMYVYIGVGQRCVLYYRTLIHLCVGLSDPYVQIVLMPERRFQIKPVETDHKSKDLNPSYYKEFNMYVYWSTAVLIHTHG